MPGQFVLHADGKHKLHHGGWLLITLGTHFLRWDQHNSTLSTRFAPLMYLFCKQQETLGAADMLVDALQLTWYATTKQDTRTHSMQLTVCVCVSTRMCDSMKYFGKTLEPGAMMLDHSDAFRAAFMKKYSVLGTFGQCWPHIIRKFVEGEYVKKTWAHFDEAKEHLTAPPSTWQRSLRGGAAHPLGIVRSRASANTGGRGT